MSSCRHHVPAATASDEQGLLGDPTIDRISQQLAEVIGLDAERLGRPAIIRAVQTALARLPADSNHAAADKTTHPDFQRQLIESIVVSESWFLREPRVFEHAVAVAKQRLLQQPKVTILSAPCAAGEEAFSLALSLLDAGIPADRFRIVATDISETAIASSRQGLFTENAFRTNAKRLQDHWFTKTDGGWRISQQVSQQVQFMQLNLLDQSTASRLLAAAGSHYDLICCRNLLIYLTGKARQQTQALLKHLLASHGEVIVGAAEAVILATDGWLPTGPLAFCQRAPYPTNQPTAPLTAGLRSPHYAPAVKSASQLAVKSAGSSTGFKRAEKKEGLMSSGQPPAVADLPPPASVPAPVNGPAAHPALTQAEQLANAGDVEAALLCCQRALEEEGPEPAVLFLAAMLEQSLGRLIEAERLLEKVVYLEPRHEAALLALALAARRRGDTALERRYRRSAALAANPAAS